MLIFHFILLLTSVEAGVVNVQPPEMVIGLGRDAVYTCESPSSMILAVEWLINGTSLDSLQLNDVNQGFQHELGIGVLRFNNVILEYNDTRIQCIANTTTRGVVTSGTSTLFIQGLLGAATALNVIGEEEFTVNFEWTAPFSLDIRITYCVDVVSSTSSATLHSECGITVTEFTYPLPPRSWCDVYNFTVTPVNMVGNGTRASTLYTLILQTPEVITANRLSILTISVIMSSLVCYSELTFVDDNTKEIITLGDTDLIISETNITFTTQQLRQNRRYNVTVTASNVAGSATSLAALSTHDVRNSTTEKDSYGNIIIETDYYQHSSASGALYIFVPLDDSGAADLTGAVYLALDRNTSHNHTLPFSLSGERMEVFVYDIESDGTLASGVGYPAVNRKLVVTSDNTSGLPFQTPYSLLESCQTSVSNHIITQHCAYPNNSAATGFQVVVAQQSSAERLYIDQAVNFQAVASVLVEEIGLYQVTVFAIQRERGIMNSTVEYIDWLMVNDAAASTAATSTAATTVDAVPTIGTFSSQSTSVIISMGVGLGIAVILLCVMIMVLASKKRKINCCNRSKPVELHAIQLDRPHEEAGKLSRDIPQLYTVKNAGV